jgi:uncharacterized cupin superfamily protein
MPERPRPDLSGVRDAMRERDDATAGDAAPSPPPRLGYGPTDMASGVTTTQIDFEGEERFQTLRRDLGVSAFGISVLRFRPGQRSRIHRHERQEEVYVVLEGTLSLAAEGEEERRLERGGVARVAPDVRRQLTNRGDVLLVVLAIGGAQAHEGRDGVAYERWEDEEGRPPQEVPLPPDLPA